MVAEFACPAAPDFAEVTREDSGCPSGRRGGELGSFGRGQMVRELDAVVFSVPLDEAQGPVRTQFGYHSIEVTSREG